LCQPPDEGGPGRRLYPSDPDQLEQQRDKGWFYLRNDPEFALPAYTGNSIAESRSSWSDGPAKTEQEKILWDHWVVLQRLRGAEITLAKVVGQYHARGVVLLRWRPLQLCEMTADRAPWRGTMTPPSLLRCSRSSAAWRRQSGGRPTRGRRRDYSRCSPTRGQKKL
jgi:hypothetical protein